MSILSALRDWAEAATSGWRGAVAPQALGPIPARGTHHEEADATQCHIALACNAAPETDADAILWKAAIAVLSGGMSGRLFTEVREKRGLCYSVYATYAGAAEFGSVLAYATAPPPRAPKRPMKFWWASNWPACPTASRPMSSPAPKSA